jgi:glycosyltransferase involved in cell wall biosynthesis
MPGPERFERLPALAQAADVLIMPYRDLPVTRAMQPLKFKEYLATGKPVVARKLPAAVEWQDAADLVESPEAFIAAIDSRIGQPLPDEQVAARKRLSRETWENKAAQLWDVLCGKEPEQVGRESSAEP